MATKSKSRIKTKKRKVRAPSNTGTVTSPTFINLSDQLTSPRRGTRELLRLFDQSPWLRAIVGKIARAVAETDWVIHAKKNSQGKFIRDKRITGFKNPELHQAAIRQGLANGDIKTITDHPLLDLLEIGTGDPRLNGFGVMQITQCHLDLVGESFWLIERGAMGLPVGVWPIPPHWVTQFPDEKNPSYQISAQGGLRVNVPMSEIVSIVDPSPENPYSRGTSISYSLDDEIQIDEFAAKHQKSFFLNRARPDIIISGQFISPKDSERLERQWLSDHQGFMRAFKPLFFSQKIDVKELTQSFESMQMVQIRKHERDTFISVFGCPPEKLGVIGESKRSTIAAADYFWSKDIIRPRIETIRRSLQAQLVPQFDERIILSYDTPVIQDDEHRLKIMHEAPWAFTINEWRGESSYKSLGDAGEVVLMPLNSQFVPVNNLLSGGQQDNDDTDNDDSDTDDNMPQSEETYEQVNARKLAREITEELLSVLDRKLIE